MRTGFELDAQEEKLWEYVYNKHQRCQFHSEFYDLRVFYVLNQYKKFLIEKFVN